MKNLESIIALAKALAPYVQPAEAIGEAIFAAVKSIGAGQTETEAQADDDLKALIAEALVAKAARDNAAAGNDPQ